MATRTRYAPEDGQFSVDMHKKAQSQLYPKIYRMPIEDLSFNPLTNASEDLDEGIDLEVEVTVRGRGFRQPFTDHWQERFRRLENCRGLDDVTITEWNNTTNKPSEFYKIRATLFHYAKYDKEADRFPYAVAFYVHPALMRVRDGTLPFERFVNAKNQTVITIKVADLVRLKVVQFIRWPGIERSK